MDIDESPFYMLFVSHAASKRREGLLGQSGCRLPVRRKVSPLLGRKCSGQSAREKIL